MKKLVTLSTLIFFATHTCLFSQQPPPPAVAEAPMVAQPAESSAPVAAETPKAVQPVGSSAAASTRTGRSTSWQNWVFAGAAIVVAAIGIVVVSLDHGEDVH